MDLGYHVFIGFVELFYEKQVSKASELLVWVSKGSVNPDLVHAFCQLLNL